MNTLLDEPAGLNDPDEFVVVTFLDKEKGYGWAVRDWSGSSIVKSVSRYEVPAIARKKGERWVRIFRKLRKDNSNS